MAPLKILKTKRNGQKILRIKFWKYKKRHLRRPQIKKSENRLVLQLKKKWELESSDYKKNKKWSPKPYFQKIKVM